MVVRTLLGASGVGLGLTSADQNRSLLPVVKSPRAPLLAGAASACHAPARRETITTRNTLRAAGFIELNHFRNTVAGLRVELERRVIGQALVSQNRIRQPQQQPRAGLVLLCRREV